MDGSVEGEFGAAAVIHPNPASVMAPGIVVPTPGPAQLAIQAHAVTSIGPAMAVSAIGFAAHERVGTVGILGPAFFRQYRPEHAQRDDSADNRGGMISILFWTIAAAAAGVKSEVAPTAVIHPDAAPVMAPGVVIATGPAAELSMQLYAPTGVGPTMPIASRGFTTDDVAITPIGFAVVAIPAGIVVGLRVAGRWMGQRQQ